MDELDKELEQRINDIYPKFKNFVEFVRRYNNNQDYGNQLFSDYDQEAVEITLEALEEVHNSFWLEGLENE